MPFTADYKLFKKMAGFGEELSSLHLLKSEALNASSVKFEGKGDSRVDKVRYEKGRVFINPTQYFEKLAREYGNTRLAATRCLKNG